MTHDVDALVKRAETHAVDIEQCSLFVDSTPLKRSMTDAAEFLREAATALQAEHEARVKAEGERDGANDAREAHAKCAAALIAAAEANATAAEAQLASALDAWAALEPLAQIAFLWTEKPPQGGEVERYREAYWNMKREALRALTPSPQNIGQGLSEKGQNVSESENASGMEGWRPWSTVPRDDEAVLATDNRVAGGFPQVVYWDCEAGGWHVSDATLQYDEGFFTHWRRDCLFTALAAQEKTNGQR